jgi:dihydroflavonol-4-reductase
MDSNNTLLITGATGQLGSFLLAELLGWGQSPTYSGTILCAKRPTSPFKQLEGVAEFYGQPSKAYLQPHIHFVDLDLESGADSAEWLAAYCTQHKLQIVSSVIHSAAVIDINQSAIGGNKNERITAEMLHLAEALDVEHFTHVSSIAVMGGNAPLGQLEILEPKDFQPTRKKVGLGSYAKSKIYSELQVWRAQQEGLSTSVVRPGVILGIGPLYRAPQELWKRLWKGTLPFATDGCSGVVDVRDVAAIVYAVHEDKTEGPVIAVAEHPTFYQLLQWMQKGLGKTRKIRFLRTTPWLNRMRAVSFLSKIPWMGKYVTAQMRIMLFSKTHYNGSSGAIFLKNGYRNIEDAANELGKFMRKQAEN